MKEYEVLINGNIYDIRNEDDRRYLESINYFDKQKEEVIVAKNKTEIIEEGWEVPMPTKKKVISNKKMDYKTLGIMTLISNRKTEYIEGIDITEAEEHRYIYEKGTNSILSNKDYIETMSKNKIKNVRANLRKLANCDNDVVTYLEDEHGNKYYKIMPYIIGENGKLQYVKIDSRILEFLCNTSNSNGIKIYCTLLWLLWDEDKKQYVERPLTRDFICKQIGLSDKCENNLTMIGQILMNFKNNNLLNRRSETITLQKKGENTIVKTIYYYSITDINSFLNRTNYYVK